MLLLTGDARGDFILKGLENAGLLKKNGGTMHVDLLKVPHHGSSSNLEDDFFERITADHYVFWRRRARQPGARLNRDTAAGARQEAVQVVRPDWSPAKNALAPVLKKLAKGQKVMIVDAAKPHIIDPKGPLGY